jgi:hypothetical protein
MSGRLRLPALLAAGLLALLAGCRSTSTCKEGTILLTVDLGPGAGPTTRLSVRVTSGGDLLSSGEVDRPAGQSHGTIEIGFAGRYPGAQMVVVEVSARSPGGTLATRTVSMRLEPGCSTLSLDLLAADAGADTRDAGPDRTADGAPDRQRDGGVPPPDAAADRSPDASPDLAPVPDAGPDAEPDAGPDAAPDLAPDATMAGRRVFATSSRHTGNLGGLAGAHAICQQIAAEAGLPGTYRAWLSDALSGPASTMVHSSVPYVLVTGERIADNWADLTDGSIRHAIDRDERGRLLDPEPFVCEGGEVWSNTTATGTSSGLADCLGWRATGATSNNGSMKQKNGRWTDDTCDNTSCLTDLPLYCFEQ